MPPPPLAGMAPPPTTPPYVGGPATGVMPPPIYGQPPVVQTTNGLSVASLVLGIVWVFGLGSILAVIFGFIGRKQIRQSGGTQSGGGMATAGIVLGCIGVVGLILWIVAIAVVTTSTNNCFDQLQNNSNTTTCSSNTGTGNSGFGFNTGSTGNSAAPFGHSSPHRVGLAALTAAGSGSTLFLTVLHSPLEVQPG